MAPQIPEKKPKASAALRFSHPLLTCVFPWLVGLGLMLMVIYALNLPINFQLAPEVPAGLTVLPLVIGIIGGSIAAFRERPLLRRNIESIAQGLVFPAHKPRSQKEVTLAVIGLLATESLHLIVPGLLKIVAGNIVMGLLAGFGAFLSTRIFLYPERAAIYRRARQISAGEAPELYQSPIEASGLLWPQIIGSLTVMAALFFGLWYLWWLPGNTDREIRQQAFAREPGGSAARLCYGDSVAQFSLSPDGDRLALVRRHETTSYLQILTSRGKIENPFDREDFPEPTLEAPPAWSPDGRRILLMGELKRKNADEGVYISSYPNRDLWLVDYPEGKLHRLTTGLRAESARWVTSTAIAATAQPYGFRRLWLMDDRDAKGRLVENFVPTDRPRDIRPWSRGRLLAKGANPKWGLWSVDSVSGKAAPLSAEHFLDIFPLNDTQLVFLRRLDDHTLEIGRFDTVTGVAARLRSIAATNGDIKLLAIARSPAAVFFTGREPKSSEGWDLWALTLADKRLHRITQGESIQTAVYLPGEESLFYCEPVRNPKVPIHFETQYPWRLDLDSDFLGKEPK
jgi:hypothetical protein